MLYPLSSDGGVEVYRKKLEKCYGTYMCFGGMLFIHKSTDIMFSGALKTCKPTLNLPFESRFCHFNPENAVFRIQSPQSSTATLILPVPIGLPWRARNPTSRDR